MSQAVNLMKALTASVADDGGNARLLSSFVSVWYKSRKPSSLVGCQLTACEVQSSFAVARSLTGNVARHVIVTHSLLACIALVTLCLLLASIYIHSLCGAAFC